MHQLRTSDQGDRMSDTTTEILPSRWDANASFWVQIIREHRDKYRNELTDPAMLKAIGEPAGLAVLDAGCGEGYLSRILAKKGATVTGVDSAHAHVVMGSAGCDCRLRGECLRGRSPGPAKHEVVQDVYGVAAVLACGVDVA